MRTIKKSWTIFPVSLGNRTKCQLWKI